MPVISDALTLWWWEIKELLPLSHRQLVRSNNKETINVEHHYPFAREIHRWSVDSPHKGPVMLIHHDVVILIHSRSLPISGRTPWPSNPQKWVPVRPKPVWTCGAKNDSWQNLSYINWRYQAAHGVHKSIAFICYIVIFSLLPPSSVTYQFSKVLNERHVFK